MSTAEARNLAAIAAAAQKTGAAKGAKAAKNAPAEKPERTKTAPSTIESVALVCPGIGTAEIISQNYGLSSADVEGTRERSKARVLETLMEFDADVFEDRAIEMHYQNIVWPLVGEAERAGNFYQDKRLQASDLINRNKNDDRDSDRDPVAGFESRADRALEYAAKAGLRAAKFRAIAEGAADAYKEITGKDWAPYNAAPQAPATIERRSRAALLNALKD